MNLNNVIFFLILILFTNYFYKYFVLFLKKINKNLLVDFQFNKPQAFHETPISTIGGSGIFLAFLLICAFLFIFYEIVYLEYLSFCAFFFILGLVDDFKINIRPKFRLLIMLTILIVLVTSNKFYLEKTGLEFLNNFLEIDIFALFFICLCFLFVVNGSNLIDGFNGLLGIHSLIILLNLFFVNYYNNNLDLAYFMLCSILILLVFLRYNFPKAKIFLGDGGSYFLGAFIAISVIKTSIANPSISPFYFCILLFYVFFEVFFSFLRKLIVERKSPLFPDKKHLHMLLYKILYKKNKDKLKFNLFNINYSSNFFNGKWTIL